MDVQFYSIMSCVRIWGEPPATQQLETGIESSDMLDDPGPSSINSGMSGNSEADQVIFSP